MKLQGGRELRRSVIYPCEGVVVLTAVFYVRTTVVNTECVENLGANYRPEFSSSLTLCRASMCFSMTSSHKVRFDTGTVRVCLFSWRYNPSWLYFSQPGSGL